MVYLICASMWSFFWTTMLLCLLMYAKAIYLTELVAASDIDDGDRDELNEYWGTLSRSILSLYQSISGGMSWGLLIKPVMDHVSVGASIVFFSIYILFATLVMLNLVTGVFVDGAQKIIQQEKEEEMVSVLRKTFRRMDEDQSDDISWAEYQTQVVQGGMDEYFHAFNLSMEQGKQLFQLLDVDDSGSLSIDEFVEGSKRLNNPARNVDVALEHRKMQENQGTIICAVNQVAEQLSALETELGSLHITQREQPSQRGGRTTALEVHKRSMQSP